MISLAVIPIVHVAPIPRVGGWGIIIGALIPILTLTKIDAVVLSYLFGCIVLLVFGAMDDQREMGHYTKFIGQIIAVIPMIFFCGIHINELPFISYDFPTWFYQAFTLVAMIGVINAINHSDGLDGLAGGETLISLGAIALIAYFATDQNLTIVIALAAIGGLVGFLRYNTHPAIVFMGDGGSQFLGFTLGFLAVHLVEFSSTDLSRTAVLLLLGLPIIDILTVLKKRAMSGSNIFRATRNHMHHRLLEAGLAHKESVVVIYTIHTFMVACGIWLQSASDWLITGFYVIVCAITYYFLNLAEKNQWRPGQTKAISFLSKSLETIEQNEVLMNGSRRFLELAIPGYLLALSIWINDIPRDFAFVAAILAVLLVLQSFNVYPFKVNTRRGIIYITVVFVIYLSTIDRVTWQNEWAVMLERMFYVSVCIAIFLAIRFSPGRRKEEFKVTSFDWLLLFLIVGALLFASQPLMIQSATELAQASSEKSFNVNVFIVVLAIILYGSELLLVERRERIDLLGTAALLTLIMITLRGLGWVDFAIGLPAS